MITGAHTLIYTPKADEMRAFFRDMLGFPHVDAGGGWPIFALPPAEMAVHPIEAGREHHEVGLMCDDLETTIAELRARGVEFAGDIAEHRWGRSIQIALPDGTELMLYQPLHTTAAEATRPPRAAV